MKYIFSTFLILCSLSCFSQGLESFKSPEAARAFEFSKFDKIPSGEYTGIPGITIPIYEVSADDVTIPVVLQYHAGGIRVSEDASHVGLGWSMNFGMITQTVNDLDDLNTSYSKKLLIYQNSPYVSEWPIVSSIGNTWTNVTPGNCPTFTPASPQATNSAFIATSALPIADLGYSYCSQLSIEQYFLSQYGTDTEPDIFRANFFGHSLTFIKKFTGSQQGQIEILNNTGYKIELVDSKWRVTTPDGDIYIFGLKQSKSSSSTSAGGGIASFMSTGSAPAIAESGGGGSSTTNYWYIEKVITTRNKEITFQYTEYTTPLSYNFSQNIRKPFWGPQMSYPVTFKGRLGGAITAGNNQFLIQTTTTTTANPSLYVTKVISPETTLDFAYTSKTDGGVKLSSITQSDNLSSQLSVTNFTYDYFSAYTAGNTSVVIGSIPTSQNNNRLKLLSVQKSGENPYVFTYNSQPLPQKNSTAVDYWGFYNGQLNNVGLAPNPSRLGYSNVGNNNNIKAAHQDYCKAALLEEVTYPTKGKAIYEYEINQFENPSSNIDNFDGSLTTLVAGHGVRLKSFTLKDNNVVQKKTNFYYTSGKDITPIKLLSKYPFMVGFCANPTEIYWANVVYNGEIWDFYSSNSYQPSLLGSFNAVGYDRVKVENISASGTLGSVETTFTNERDQKPLATVSDSYDETRGFMSLPSLPNIESKNNGLRLNETVYDANGDITVEKIFQYLHKKSTIYYGNKFSNFRDLVYLKIGGALSSDSDVNTVQPQFLVGYYAIFGKRDLLSSEKVIEHFSSGNKEVTTSYSYNSNDVLIATYKNSPNQGEFYRETMTPSSQTVHLNKNMLRLPVNKSVLENGATKNIETISYTEVNNITLPLVDTHSPQGNSGPAYARSIYYDQYDEFGNVLQFHDQDNIYTSIVWGYKNLFPIAEIKNCQYNTIPAATINNLKSISNYESDSCYTGTCSEKNLIAALNALRTSLFDSMVVTYTYNPGVGITSITDEKGYTTFYEFDEHERLKAVRDADGNIITSNEYYYKQ